MRRAAVALVVVVLGACGGDSVESSNPSAASVQAPEELFGSDGQAIRSP